LIIFNWILFFISYMVIWFLIFIFKFDSHIWIAICFVFLQFHP
jgi:hypothetical protein